MNSIQENFRNAAKAFVTNMVTHDSEEWPPTCFILAYQPERPIQQAVCQQVTCDDLSVQPSSK